jgi:AcrR family transcriptional regulator
MIQSFRQKFRGETLTTVSKEANTRDRIIKAALRLFARQGYDGTTTKDLATAANIAEGTLFRYFVNKKAILIEVAISGWIDILTDLLTELSEMESYKAVDRVMCRRMLKMQENNDLLRVCFIEAQSHPELNERIQTDVIAKMTDVAEAFFQTAMDKGIYRQMNPKIVAQVFLGMFAIAGFSNRTIIDPQSSPAMLKEIAEVLSEIFLNGVLTRD